MSGYDKTGARRVTQEGTMNYPDISDNGVCDRCGKTVNMDATPPCEHGVCCCDSCGIAACLDCAIDDLADPRAALGRVIALRDRWKEAGWYGRTRTERADGEWRAKALTKALEGDG